MKLHWLELRIPPVGVLLIAGTGVAALSEWGLRVATVGSLRWVFATAWVVAAAAVGLTAVATFRRARTTVNPMDPSAARTVVRDGIYGVTRNPMYVALLLVLVGWAVYLGATWGWAVLPGFVGYLTRFQIIPEERALSSSFGPAYAEYLGTVRRWI